MPVDFDSAAFAERLILALDRQHMSQSQLAAALGVSRSTITGWIRHHKLPDAFLIYQLCGALRCTADWLLGLEAKPIDSGKIRWAESALPVASPGIDSFRRIVNGESVPSASDWQLAQFALRSGVVRVQHVERNPAHEAAIKGRYPSLTNVIVADLPFDDPLLSTEMAAFLAAVEVLGQLIRPGAVGLGSGYTMLRLCEYSLPSVDQFNGTLWVPLLAFAPQNTSDYTANFLARLMRIRHPGSRAMYLPHPGECTTPELHIALRDTTQAMHNTQAVFVSVSGVDRRGKTGNTHLLSDFRSADYDAEAPDLRSQYAALPNKARFGAELLRYLLDRDGTIIARDPAVGSQVDLEILRYNSTVRGISCLVAAGHYKASAVEVCIRSQLVNTLVIDSTIARYLQK